MKSIEVPPRMATVLDEEEAPMSDHRTREYAMISTFPPTQCGIATFAAALSGGSTTSVMTLASCASAARTTRVERSSSRS